MENKGYKITIQNFKNASIIWVLLGLLLLIIGDLQIATGLFAGSDFFSYGKTKPFINNSIIFGGIVSLFFANVFKVLDELEIKQPKLEIVGFISFAVYQMGIVFGIFISMLGFNKGRTFGEMNFISDNLIMLVLTIVIVLSLVHSFKYGKLNGKLQFIIVILAGMITTYFIGNFGFPNSYITNVPPTSGFQDVFVQNIYSTSIFVYYVILPLLFIIYSIIVDFYKLDPEKDNFVNVLLFISVLVPFTAGANLNHSSNQNFWTSVGNYVSIAIDLMLLSIAYYLHLIYVNHKESKPLYVVRVSGIFISIILILNAIIKLPIFHNYVQYSYLDAVNFVDKIVYAVLLLISIFVSLLHKRTDISNTWVSSIFILGILAILFISIHGVIQSHNMFSLTQDGSLAVKTWSEILDKVNIFQWLKLIIELVVLILGFYTITISDAGKISSEKVD